MSTTSWTSNRITDRIVSALAIVAAGILVAPIVLFAIVPFVG